LKSETEQLEDIFTTLDLMDATVSELTEEMEKGNLTAVQLVQMYIDRIKKYDESLNLNSIISINPNALKEAEELDKERQAGNIKGKLHGIPVIVKDNYDVAGMATTAGSISLSESIANDDSYAVKQLKDAGAVILAKANMSEFALSGGNSNSTLGGTVHNAYDTSRTSAGSSGGTAVAITCNFATIGLGTDTGVSIRRPSSFANIFGLRPSKGLTSIDGVVPCSAERDVTGPMCRTAEDLAILLEVMAGTDTADSFTVEADADKLKGSGYTDTLSTDGLKGKKIGYLSNSFGYNVAKDDTSAGSKTVAMSKEITAMVRKTRANLAKAGAKFVDISDLIPESMIAALATGTWVDTFEYDMNTYLSQLGSSSPVKTVKNILETGYGIGHTNITVWNAADSLETTKNPYTENGNTRTTAWANMTAFREQISKILEDNGIDAVMYVGENDIPDKQDTSDYWNESNRAYYMSGIAPVTGLPDVTIPMGMSSESDDSSSMPLGMSLFTSYGNDKTLMEIAYAYEQQCGDSIREMPENTPALEDKNVEAFLEDLMEKVYDIDYDNYTVYPKGKVNLMYAKYEAAAKVNYKDVSATYDAAYALAKAYDAVMDALSGNEKTTTETDVAKPSKVSGLTLSRTSDQKKIKTTYKKVSGAAGYQVAYSTSKDFTEKTTKKVFTTKNTLTISSLNAPKTYYVKVRAYKVSNGTKVYGAWSSVSVGVAKPSKVSGFTLNRTSDKKKIKITYKKVSGAAGYQVAYSTSKNFTEKTTKKVSTSKNTLTLSKLNAKKTYYVKVRAYKVSDSKKIYGEWTTVKSKK
jgi:Asp-tRNA(Asn)/Glu-tRNA(Gln) amidotransferase A subunit family amidase